MASYFVQRLAGTIPVLLLISLLVFSLIHAAPGDPTLLLLGEETNAADVAQGERTLGLGSADYTCSTWRFLESAAVGDFGKSFKYSEPVIRVIKNRLPATIELAIFAILIAIVVGDSARRLGRRAAELVDRQSRHDRSACSASACRASGWRSC